jgi:Uma2 family endonuclease
MTLVVDEPDLEAQLISERQAAGLDRYDEVWDGVYMIMPLADDEHQELATNIGTVCTVIIQWPGLGQVRVGINVSDRRRGWKQSYRCPDVGVFLNDTAALNCRTHWVGGADFTVEIVSPRDRSREKIGFYEKVGVRELLLIDRDPWKLELYRRHADRLVTAGTSRVDQVEAVTTEVVPLTWRLIEGDERPKIEINHVASGQRWLI